MPTLKTNDAELFYEEAGSGEPVLLLHGLGSSTLDWAPQIEALKGSFRVIARIDYEFQAVSILHVLTHQQYDQGKWKDECECD